MFHFAKIVSLTSFAFVAGAVAAPNTPRQIQLPPPFNGTHTGEATVFEPGLGACGLANGPNDLVVAISAELFDTFPGSSSICQESITASFEGRSVTAQVVDLCRSCAEFDLDFSPAAFEDLVGDLPIGPIRVNWFFD